MSGKKGRVGRESEMSGGESGSRKSSERVERDRANVARERGE